MHPQETTSPRVVGVARLSGYLRNILTNDKWLRNIGVRGEITNLRGESANLSPQKSGNVYFDLKDADALLSCVVWSERAAELPKLENGQAVIAYGEISAYTKTSKYQLIAYRVEPEGIGRLHEMFERLKGKLEKEGAFAAERKQPLPRFPFRLALISSRGAAGAADFLKILRERAPQVEVDFVETPVQGVAAASEIVRAINRTARLAVDCIVIARGGGSYEDLFAFNTEEVARAILRCERPLISAVGHESDVTIADLVADRRAETPSAAAHIVAPATRDELVRAIRTRGDRLERLARGTVQLGGTHLERILGRSTIADPARIVGIRRQHLDRAFDLLTDRARERRRRLGDGLGALQKRLEKLDPSLRLAERARLIVLARGGLERIVERRVSEARSRLRLILAEMTGKDPEAILQQGYAIVRYEGRSVRDVETVPDGAVVRAKLARGTLIARVERKEADAAE